MSTATRTTAEYIGAKWGGPPRAYGRGRDGKGVRLSVIHYTAGAEGRTSAEDGNAYDKRRTDGTSCHAFHDRDSTVQEVDRADRSNSAYSKGNRLGIHHELCGTVQTRAQWFDEASDPTLWRAARAVAQDCVDFQLEPRRLTVPEVRAAWYSYPNGPRGICGHVDITYAFPEDGGNHTDPGAQFPWDVFIERVKIGIAELTGAPTAPAPTGRKARHSMVLYFTTRKTANGDTPVWALAGASPGTPANWQEVYTQTEANAFSALVGASALQRTPEKFEALRSDFLSPLIVLNP